MSGGRVTIVSSVQTCLACPSQWDAKDRDGRELYLRFRSGHGTVELGGPGGELLAEFDTGDYLDGSITLPEFCRRAGIEMWGGRHV